MTDLQKKNIEVEQSLDELSRYLDGLFRIPGVGWKFGLDALIGLIPNVGDTLMFVPSAYILFAGVRHGVPKITLLRMAFNIGLDYLVGLIPLAGDAFDLVWRANKKNVELIRTRATGETGTRSDYLFVILIILALLAIRAASIAISLYIIGSIFWELFTLNI